MDELPADTRLLTPLEAARRLRVQKQTLAVWRHRDLGPAYVRCGRSIRYTPEAIAQYVERRTITPGV